MNHDRSTAPPSPLIDQFQTHFRPLKTKIKRLLDTPKKNSQTAPAFLITDQRVFEEEKKRLIDYINKVQEQGRAAYEGKASHSFGLLTADQWNVMFYKHLDHHLKQFGV